MCLRMHEVHSSSLDVSFFLLLDFDDDRSTHVARFRFSFSFFRSGILFVDFVRILCLTNEMMVIHFTTLCVERFWIAVSVSL